MGYFKISFFWPVFHAEKYGGKIFLKFEFFEFLRKQVSDKLLIPGLFLPIKYRNLHKILKLFVCYVEIALDFVSSVK